jgi:hypothetical protein
VQSLSKGKTTVFIKLIKLDPDYEGKDCECCNRCVKSDCATIFKCGCGETGFIYVPEFPGDEQTYEIVFIADGPIKASVQFKGAEDDDLVVLSDDMLPYLCGNDDEMDEKKDGCDYRKSYRDNKKDDDYINKKDFDEKEFAITTGPLTLDEGESIFWAVQSLGHGRTNVDVLLVKLDPNEPKENCECCNICVKADCTTIFHKCCGENGQFEPPTLCGKPGAFEVIFIANKPIRASIETDTVENSNAFLVPAARMQPYIVDEICDRNK